MTTLQFNGDTDAKVWTPISTTMANIRNQTNGYTIIILIKKDVLGGVDYCGLMNSGNTAWYHSLSQTSTDNLWDDDGVVSTTCSVAATDDTSNWWWYAVDGSNTAALERYHWRNQTSLGSWTHNNSSGNGTSSLATPGTSGKWRVGDMFDEGLNGTFSGALCAVWANTRFADSDYGSWTKTSDLYNHPTKGTPDFISELTSTSPVDLTGNNTYSAASSAGTILGGGDPDNFTFDQTGGAATTPFQVFFTSNRGPDNRKRQRGPRGLVATYFAGEVVVSGQSVNINQVVETNLAQPLAEAKSKAIVQATETDLARALTAAKSLGLNRATETDIAQALTRSKAVLLNRVTETDLARGLVAPKLISITRVIETNVARTLSAAKSKAINRVVETDIAQPLNRSKSRLLVQATETDIARALTKAKAKAITQVTETNIARALTASKSAALARVVETDVARALTRLKSRTISQVVETDIARPLGKAKSMLIGRVVETDIARSFAGFPVFRATETNLARALVSSKSKAINRTVETNIARVLTHPKSLQIARVLDTNIARALAASKARVVNRATETDSARVLGFSRSAVLNRVIETNLAQALSTLGKFLAGMFPETGHAQSIDGGHAAWKSSGSAHEGETGQNIQDHPRSGRPTRIRTGRSQL